jgi:glycosyltransferase involved in cell wall biosynthesis
VAAPPAWPPYLHAVPAELPAFEWHTAAFEKAAALGDVAPWHRAKRHYHEAWLRWLDDPAEAPLVSIVMPAYNEGQMILEAIASCRRQTHPNIEIVIVDDGSEVPVADTVPAAGDLRIVRQENAGPAAARNRGMLEARGDLIHFLDADDWLEPDCVERKLTAMRLVPDADLAFSDYFTVGENATTTAAEHPRPPVGDEFCPSLGLLRAASRRFVFNITTVLVARWIVLAANPIRTDLRQAEDSRYWFELGMYGAKAIGLDVKLSTRRLRFEGLSSDRRRRLGWWARVAVLNLTDLLGDVARWPYVGSQMARLNHRELWELVNTADEDPWPELRSGLIRAIASSPEVGEKGLQSPRPVLALLRQLLRRTEKHGYEDSAFVQAMSAAVDEAAEGSAPLDTTDIDMWLNPAQTPTERKLNQAAISTTARWLDGQLDKGRPPVPSERLAQLAADWPELKQAERWAAAARPKGLLARLRSLLARA